MRIGDAIPNFRDLGGLPTDSGAFLPYGRIVRTSALLHVRGVRADLLHGLLPAAVYFDLRTEVEAEHHGPLALPEGWTHRHRPMHDSDLGRPVEPEHFEDAWQRYRPIVLEMAEAAAGAPVIVSCSLGKDRTGLAMAALLHMLGVSREAIVEDYRYSNDCLGRFRFDRPYHLVEADHCGAWLDFLDDHLDAPPAVIAGLRALVTEEPHHAAG
jgi:protein-tyrosine phosphatase